MTIKVKLESLEADTHTHVLKRNLILRKINIEAYVLYSLLCVCKEM